MSHEEFWDWFDRDPSKTLDDSNKRVRIDQHNNAKEAKMMGPKRETKIRHIRETEAGTRADARYCIMHGRQRPGKKNKVWEDDGYLTLVGPIAHLCDLKGRMLEEPTLLDDVDLETVRELGELLIGTTEVQVVELDEK